MNHWCVKQILHLVRSKNLLLLYQFTFAQNRPKSDISGALRPIHYITLKAFAMALGDRTKCKTCSECPRMVLYGPWKTIISKIEFGSGWPPPVWWITRLFTRFFLWNLHFSDNQCVLKKLATLAKNEKCPFTWPFGFYHKQILHKNEKLREAIATR